jgi:hypothetical protein
MINLSGGMSDLRLDVLFALFAECTRLRSLHIIGETSIVCKLLDTLHSATPVRSLCLDITDRRPVTSVELPDDLFAPIRELSFITEANYILVPRWLLRGITYFTSNQQIPLQDLLDTLGQMPVLHSFTLERCVPSWRYIDAQGPSDVQIRMPSLMYFAVDINTVSPIIFGLLHRRLSLPDGAKKRIRTHKSSEACNLYHWHFSISPMVPPSVQEVVKAANGLQQVRFFGGRHVGSFLLWADDAGHGEAEISFEFSSKLRESNRDFLIVSDLLPLFNLLGVERVRMLTLFMNSQDPIQLEMSSWRDLLMSMPTVEELELCVDAVRKLHSVWNTRLSSAVFSELRRLRVVPAANSTSSVVEIGEELMGLLPSLLPLCSCAVLPTSYGTVGYYYYAKQPRHMISRNCRA